MHHTSAAANLAPASPGGSVLANLAFNDASEAASTSTTSTGSFSRCCPAARVDGGYRLDNLTISAVPEPQSLAMMLAGIGALGFVTRRRGSIGT